MLAHKKEMKTLLRLDGIMSRLQLLQAKKYWSPVNAESHVISAHIEATMQALKLLFSVIILSDMSVRILLGGVRLTSDARLTIPDAIHNMRVWVQILDRVEEHCRRSEPGQYDEMNAVLKLWSHSLKTLLVKTCWSTKEWKQ